MADGQATLWDGCGNECGCPDCETARQDAFDKITLLEWLRDEQARLEPHGSYPDNPTRFSTWCAYGNVIAVARQITTVEEITCGLRAMIVRQVCMPEADKNAMRAVYQRVIEQLS